MPAIETALRSGIQVLQYRDKTQDHIKRLKQAQALKALCRDYAVPLIINDDVSLAQQIQADGVHLGKDDDRLLAARLLLGREAIIGVSCYNQLEQAQQAQAEGVDYIAFGSFYPSSTKPQAVRATPDLLRQAKPLLHVPIVAIGGIEPHNAAILLESGADFLAVITGIFGQDDVAAAVRGYQDVFEEYSA